MSTTLVNMSMSLDGYVAGPDDGPDRPLGVGGDVLHRWMLSGGTAHAERIDPSHHGFFRTDEPSTGVLARLFGDLGAMVVGRRMHDVVDGWHGTYPVRDVPVFVVTHAAPPRVRRGRTRFTYVTGGVEPAIARAREAAGDRTVGIAGASVAQQCVRAGLVDELMVHVVPVLLGGGVRLFDLPGLPATVLEPLDTVVARDVVHLRYRLPRR